MVPSLFLLLSLTTQTDALDACLSLDASAQPAAMVTACEGSSSEGEASARVRALRRLARAHAALGHDDAASESWFRVLLFSGTAHPDAGASERERRAFEVALNRLYADAPFILRATRRKNAPEVFDITFTDPGRRALALTLHGPDGPSETIALERGAEGTSHGVVSLASFIEGRDRVAATIEATGLDGGPASHEPLAVLEWPSDATPRADVARPAGGAVLLTAGSLGLLYGIGTAVTWASAAQELERAQAARDPIPDCFGWCVGSKPYLLGVSGDDRQTLLDGGAPGWMAAGALVATTGLLLTAGGVFVLVTGGE